MAFIRRRQTECNEVWQSWQNKKPAGQPNFGVGDLSKFNTRRRQPSKAKAGNLGDISSPIFSPLKFPYKYPNLAMFKIVGLIFIHFNKEYNGK
ncbi:MAG: hypothetical protein Q8K64_11790 [Sediminibacterium sp.]|nr:hypothetical protein [Sediminibacterium sp.]